MAAIAKTLTRPETQTYLAELERMTKVVLKAENEAQLTSLASSLTSGGIPFHAWTEEPEHVAVALASAPDSKSRLQPLFRHLKLFK